MLRDARGKRFKEGQTVLIEFSGRVVATVAKTSSVLIGNHQYPPGTELVTFKIPDQEVPVPLNVGGLGMVFILDDPTPAETDSAPTFVPAGGMKM